MAAEDITPWFNRITKAKSRSEVFGILDDFRKCEWSDMQCSAMAKLYMRVLDKVGANEPEQEAAPAPVAPEESGPVWYEKM